MSIRRVADVWEWGNNVLWPGIFGNNGPCDGGVVGMRGRFRSAQNWTDGTEFDLRAGEVNLTAIMDTKGCSSADAWPDGEGSFHMDGAVGWTMAEVVERMDTLDWTEGVRHAPPCELREVGAHAVRVTNPPRATRIERG